jgi:hypothetical protein
MIMAMNALVLADGNKKQEKRLWDVAQRAMADGRFSVANGTLQTLLNTYPRTKYAARIRRQLLDPRILATCGGWGIPPVCNEEQLSALISEDRNLSK